MVPLILYMQFTLLIENQNDIVGYTNDVTYW